MRYSSRKFFKCGKFGQFITKCPIKEDKEDEENKNNKNMYYKKHKGDYKGRENVAQQWDSNSISDSNTDSSSNFDTCHRKGVATLAISTTLAKYTFGEESDGDKPLICFMAKLQGQPPNQWCSSCVF